jgi:hypothetical protein
MNNKSSEREKMIVQEEEIRSEDEKCTLFWIS